MEGLIQIVAPTVDPVSLTEGKLHIRVDDSTDDAGITAMIAVARQKYESDTHRAIITQTYEMVIDSLPTGSGVILMPLPPLVSVTSIVYNDSDGDSQTLGTDTYVVNTSSDLGGTISLAVGETWPGVYGESGDVTITFVCGYASEFTVADTDIFTCSARTFTDADPVVLANSGGALSAELAVNTTYFVRDVSGNTFKLAATAGGTAINIADVGTGTSFIGKPGLSGAFELDRAAIKLSLGHLYEHREAVAAGVTMSKVPGYEEIVDLRSVEAYT